MFLHNKARETVGPVFIGKFADDEARQVSLGYELITGDAPRNQASIIDFLLNTRAVLQLCVDSLLPHLESRLAIGFKLNPVANATAGRIFGSSTAPTYLACINTGVLTAACEVSSNLVLHLHSHLSRSAFKSPAGSNFFNELVNVVALNTALFVAFHEVGHCIRRHLDVWNRVLGVQEIAESHQFDRSNGWTKPQERIRRALETDADDFASWMLASSVRAAARSSTQSVLQDGQFGSILVHWLTSLTFGLVFAKDDNSESRHYHSPFARSMHIAQIGLVALSPKAGSCPTISELIELVILLYAVDDTRFDCLLPKEEPWGFGHEATVKDVLRLRKAGLIAYA